MRFSTRSSNASLPIRAPCNLADATDVIDATQLWAAERAVR